MTHFRTRVRLGAVGYLNARPLVYGLDRSPRFDVRYDVPSECARLLHAHAIDVGLIPSIEFLRGGPYQIAPDLAIASRGPVASVAIFTTKPIPDVRSIALDTSSRTSVALVSVLCARRFKIEPRLESRGPDLDDMLARCDAALIIGDNALFQSPIVNKSAIPNPQSAIEKIDLGAEWTALTGLPFVWAFWAGRPGALDGADVAALQQARDEGVDRPDELAREYLSGTPERQAAGARYLRDNIKYYLGDDERAGLETFYRYAAEAGLVSSPGELRFFEESRAAGLNGPPYEET
jgi:chorismate dehydratase